MSRETPSGAVGHTIRRYDTVSSTNDLALKEGLHGVVYVAREQTLGRGRHGRQWASAAGKGLWFSVGLRMAPAGLTFAAALAVRDGLQPGLEASIRWPNDVYAGNFKICGILVEHRAGQSALGIGLNLSHGPEDFPPDLEKPAASLEMVTGHSWDREGLLGRILDALDGYVTRLQSGSYAAIHQSWAEACGLQGKTIRRDGVTGVVTQILEDGALLVATDGGVLRVDSGLITQVD